MMETTPRTRNSTRYRRVPTPKMSERKKKLFDDVLNNGDSPNARNPYVRLERLIIEENEDSDIGPMSPLEFSSSPSNFNDIHRITIARDENTKMHRIDFTNILNDDDQSEHSNKSESQERHATNRKITTDNCTDDAAKDESSEEDMMGPLCSSMKKLTSMTEQNYEQQMKTPSETTAMQKSASELIGRNASFRKSLVFDTSLTPNDDNQSTAAHASLKSSDHEHNGSGNCATYGPPKARTSLTFNEPTISVRSFYGKSMERSTDDKCNSDLTEKIDAHGFSAALAAAAAKHKLKLKSKSQAKSKSKLLSQRMKVVPSLWRFGGKSKFNQHKRQRAQKLANKKKPSLNASAKGNNGMANDENVPPTGSEFTSRIEQNLRLQKCLKEQLNALHVSREINWIGSGGGGGGIGGSSCLKSTTAKSSLLNQSEFLHSDAEDDDGDSGNENRQNQSTHEEVEVDVNVETEPTNRKFFKSSASNSAKKYRIMGRLSATLKRGGDLKFDPPPKRKKKRTNRGEENVVLHNEITSIIDRLSSPSKDRKVIANGPNAVVNRTNIVNSIDAGEFKSTMDQRTIATASNDIESNFIDKLQTETNLSGDTNEVAIFTNIDTEKYCQMIPYNTNDPTTISQQKSILDLLISNGICDDETFKIFIAEPDLHKEKAAQILDSLYCVDTMILTEYENEAATEWVNSVESMALTSSEASVIYASPDGFIESNHKAMSNIATANATPSHGISNSLKEASTVLLAQAPSSPSLSTSNVNNDNNTHDDHRSEKLFPIFNKNFNATGAKAVTTFNALPKTSRDWLPIGDLLYQLDVGQKEFGLRTCPQCEMQYSAHKLPEDELLHMKYHNCVHILTFKGWSIECVVTQMPEWNPTGRIIYVCEADSKAKKDRVKEILAMIDRDLGFATRNELKPKTLVYLAIAKQQIIGVCVVQPLECAHRLKTINAVDCYTTETYPVKCGISRIWIAPQYRRHGIAAKLITSMRGHFLFGAFLTFDVIAFSSPTEDGKKFAASLAQRNDFLIYES